MDEKKTISDKVKPILGKLKPVLDKIKPVLDKIKPIWNKWKEKSANLGRWVLIPTICYLELLFHYWIGGAFTPSLFLTLIGFALCLGGLLNIIAAALPRKISRWFTGIVIFLCTAMMMTELLIGDAYFNFMRPALVFSSAGGVVNDSEFSGIMVSMIISNLGRIAIALLPLWLLLLFGKTETFRKKRCVAASLAITLVGSVVGFAALNVSADGLNNVIPYYNFNNSMKRNGLTVSMFMELSGLCGQADSLVSDDFEFEFDLEELGITTAPTAEETSEATMAPSSAAESASEVTTVPSEASSKAAPVISEESTNEAAAEAFQATSEEPAAALSLDPVKESTEEAPAEVYAEPSIEAVTVPSEENATKFSSKVLIKSSKEAITEPSTEAVDEPSEEVTTEPSEEVTTEPSTEAVDEPSEEETAEPIPEETEPKVYQPHVISGLDFGELAETAKDSTLKTLYTYLDALPPALENEYTGLFEGKNLILITAESFNYAIIDPELTPTLYRLSTKGIQFNNAFVPLWSGSTSGGELAVFCGLAMNCEMNTYSSQKPFNTIGRQLMNQGYFSRAYHNNDYCFYDRNKTHENLGYEKYIGMGNGLEEGVEEVWPASDAEMFDFTLPQYIDQQPFSIYYMTVSAHCRYNFQGNAQSKKNQDLVQDLPYSTALKAYIACNLELEKGLTSLVAQLEEAGIADDTVIVMTADHFPYGLGTAWGNDHNCLAELYGVDKYDEIERDRNTLIIWSGCLEDMDIEIDAPVCSLDILPTLSNLFGLEYDSRLTVGRDVLGTEEAIVPWPDGSWVTELGKYESSTKKFTPYVDESQIPEGYVDRISALVRTRVNFSRSVQRCNFFTALQNAMAK